MSIPAIVAGPVAPPTGPGVMLKGTSFSAKSKILATVSSVMANGAAWLVS